MFPQGTGSPRIPVPSQTYPKLSVGLNAGDSDTTIYRTAPGVFVNTSTTVGMAGCTTGDCGAIQVNSLTGFDISKISVPTYNGNPVFGVAIYPPQAGTMQVCYNLLLLTSQGPNNVSRIQMSIMDEKGNSYPGSSWVGIIESTAYVCFVTTVSSTQVQSASPMNFILNVSSIDFGTFSLDPNGPQYYNFTFTYLP